MTRRSQRTTRRRTVHRGRSRRLDQQAFRGGAVGGFFGALVANYGFRFLGKIALGVVFAFVFVKVLLPDWAEVLIVLTAVLWLAVWLDSRLGLRANSAGGWRGLAVRAGLQPPAARSTWNRTVRRAVWVYMIFEWRDEGERLLTQEVGRVRGIRHLVYVGKTTDLDDRMQQHRQTQPWWHDELEIVLPRQCFSEEEALRVEEATIRSRAQAPKLTDRPRENRQHNPTYDADRCARLNQMAAVAA